jgi:DnaK suppressor protein
MTVDIQKMKQRLEDQKKELERQIADLDQVTIDPESRDETPEDFEAQAVTFVEQQQEQSIQYNDQALLQEVNAALKRIEDGTYGRCVVCGDPIPDARLEAMPWAARDVKDEEQLEERNLSREELYNNDQEDLS